MMPASAPNLRVLFGIFKASQAQLAPTGTLAAYLTKRFLVALGGVLAGMFVLQFLLGVEAHISSYGELELNPLEIVGLALLKVPESIYLLLPPVVALATLWMSVRLSLTSEMPVIRTFGRSALSTLSVPAAVAALIGIVVVTAANPLISAMSKKHQEMVARDNGDSTQILIQTDGLIWLRQVIDNRQTVIRSSTARDGKVFEDVHVFVFNSEGQPTRRIHAITGEFVDNTQTYGNRSDTGTSDIGQVSSPGFCLQGLRVWDSPPQQEAGNDPTREIATECLATKLTPDQIRDSLDHPNRVSFWNLFAMVGRLDEAGFSSTNHRLQLQSELAKPFYFAAMVLLGGALALRQSRFASVPLTVALSVTAILSAVILEDFARLLGEREDVHIALAAWLPPIVVFLISMGGLLHIEDW